MKPNKVTDSYILGIREGRDYLNKYGSGNAKEIIDNLKRTIKEFAANTEVGQMLRGERDFWLNQVRIGNVMI